jgi:acetylornithine deacetylase/succinyl-diaminopimelate desuccinylase-like protein
VLPLNLQDTTWSALKDEAVHHLQILLCFNTTNPPGNEAPAINYLREQLDAAGIEPRILEPTSDRLSIWARIPGNGRKRPLMLLSHVDVVPVEREHWTYDPFGGEIHQGYIYGRGAVDMKSLTAKQLTLMLYFARQQATGQQLDRDLVMLAVADEECFSEYGMGWIAQHRPDLLNAEFAINEGGGFALHIGGTRFYVCETGQKGIGRVTLRAHGDPGHASIPHNKNAVTRLARAIHHLGRASLPLHVTTTMRQCIIELAAMQKQPASTLLPGVLNPFLSESMLKLMPDQNVANSMRATLHNTAVPTLLQAGTALNVIPSEATAQLDGRIIPGQTAESFAQELRRSIADPNVDVEVDLLSTGHESSVQTELFDAFKAAIAINDPGAKVLPYLFPAVTDTRFLIPRGIKVYGFDPMKAEPGWPLPQALAHSHDERISVENMGFGMHVLYDAIARIC